MKLIKNILTNKNNSLIHVFSVMIGNILSLTLLFANNIATARLLGASVKGMYSSLTYLLAIIISFGELGLQQSVVYYLGRTKNKEQTAACAIMTSLILSLLLSFVTIGVLTHYYSGEYLLIQKVIVILLVPILLLIKTTQGVLIGVGEIGVYSRINWLSSAIAILFFMISFLYGKASLTSAILSYLLGNIVVLVIALRIVNTKIKLNLALYKFSIALMLLKKGLLYGLSSLVIQSIYRIDIFIIKSYFDYRSIGIYSVALVLAELLLQVSSAIGLVVFSRTAIEEKSNTQMLARVMRVTFCITVFISLALFSVLPLVVDVFFGREYYDSIIVSRVLIVGMVFFSIYKISNTRMAGKGKPEKTLSVMVPVLIVKLISSLILTESYGIIGAAIATDFSYIVAAVFLLLLLKKEEGLEYKEMIIIKVSDIKYLINALRSLIM